MKPLVYKKAKRVRHAGARFAMRLHVTKGDTVQVISGDDKGKRGKVLRVYPKTGRVTVQGVNIVKRHQRADARPPRRGSSSARRRSTTRRSCCWIRRAATPTRVRRRIDADGTVERIAVKSGQPIPRNR